MKPVRSGEQSPFERSRKPWSPRHLFEVKRGEATSSRSHNAVTGGAGSRTPDTQRSSFPSCGPALRARHHFLRPAAGRASQARLIEEADGPDPSKQAGLPGEGPEQESTPNTFLGRTCGSLVCMNNL